MSTGIGPDFFDRNIDRTGTGSTKYDGRGAMFGQPDVIPAWVADMDFAAPPAVTQALIERAGHPIYGYTLFSDSLYQAAIDWMQRRHGWAIERDWIVMCPGVVPSLNAAVMTFTQPGESVIIQPPVYFPFFSAVTRAGRKLIENPLKFERGHYTFDFDHLEYCAQKAKLLLLCSPHNPVGRVWTSQELARLLQIAEKHDLMILSDEIHADLVYPECRHTVLATLPGSERRVITAMAPSKTFNIPGLNLSMLIIPDQTIRKAVVSIFETWHVSASNPFSNVAFEIAYREGDEWLDALRDYLGKTRDCVTAFLDRHLSDIRLTPSEGTYLLWLDCKAMKMTDASLKQFFIAQAGVGLSPGILFGKQGSGFMRLNIGASRKIVTQILENIRAAYDRPR
ncbi:cystathione beta-lyase [Nitrosomonas marina]|uniref:cysteine-S-conjugate beta-lyase n=1 Tax=Nitrosomonas marina TaxID=917 RepID=A0A1I0B4Y2_9PROT|nr:pyridoxal phosphate-dependent aminotransferase [Nitrosomonas marina]SET01748.1 cystathione beta-lyase [Nitrosomonas marina]